MTGHAGIVLCMLTSAVAGLLWPVAAGSAESPTPWRLEVELAGGAPYNFETPLRIEQSGQPEIETTARFVTMPMRLPFYWDARVAFWRGKSGWALTFLHHKLLLRDNHPDIQSFEVTHGANFMTIQRLWDLSGAILDAGIGVVMAHPESRVREQGFTPHDGFLWSEHSLTGPAGTVGLGKRVTVSETIFVALTGRATIARIAVPVHEGEARLTNVALHLQVGLGFRLRSGGDG